MFIAQACNHHSSNVVLHRLVDPLVSVPRLLLVLLLPQPTSCPRCPEVDLVLVQRAVMAGAQAVHSPAAYHPDISAALVKGEWLREQPASRF
jgi:hypothetical protein